MATYRHSYVFRLASDPVFYAWTGHGLLVTPPGDDFDPSGATWLGAAHIISVPDLKVLINGMADRLDLQVSGVSAEALRLAQEDRATIQNAQALIGRISFDTDWQLSGGVTWLWRGFSDVITVASQHSDNGRQRNISLSIRTGDTSRANPQPLFFTDADQRKRSPDDDFFKNVAAISIGVARRFGPS